MKRIVALSLALLLCLSACSGNGSGTGEPSGTPTPEPVELTLWTYPVGGWGNSSTLSNLIAAFHRDNPDIRVSVQTLSYDTGDAAVEEALAAGEAPDLILEGPERLVANWGARGLMEDLGDLWAEQDQIYDSVRVACHDAQEHYYIYPLCMSTHCMAINRDLFEAAGAWQYVDEQTHTWTTDGFFAAVAALHDYGLDTVATVYCGGQGGDQGTRALVNNLYSGTFTDPAHSRYTADSPENIQALTRLAQTEGIVFDPTIVGADEVTMFGNGELAMAFCWNVYQEVNQVVANPDQTFDIFPMAFPTDDGVIELQGGIWGFGVFRQEDARKLEAARTFIRYMTQDDSRYTRSVLASTYWPVRDMPGIYDNDQLMNEYGIFQQYLGDYYQVTPGWAEARTAWWTMLQQIGRGEDVAAAVAIFAETANAAAEKQMDEAS